MAANRKPRIRKFLVTPYQKEALRYLRPPEDINVSEWAAKYRVLESKTSSVSGPWMNDKTPYLVGIMDELRNPETEETIFCKPTQVGGTEVILNCIGYIVQQDPSPTMVVYPIDTLGKSVSTNRIEPMLLASPTLKALYHQDESSVMELQFDGMYLSLVGSNSPASLASKAIRFLFLDEVDKYHIQGDDGTAIIYAIIGCCMMFAAGLSWKYILGAVSAAAVAMATAFAFFSDKIGKGYQWYRILAVIDPDNKTGWAPSETIWKNIIYQQQRGEIALGSGGIFGNGLFGGSYYSVPNAHNDFILSWIGNAAGFVGCCVVLGVLFALVIKTFLTGARSEDLLGTFICAGIGGALLAQIAVNVGMNLRVLPVIGVTLPFYSAGGSSVLMLYICVGLVLSVYTHNTKKLFG